MTLLENLAVALRALPDEELVEAAAPWIAARVGGAAPAPAVSVAAKKGHETRKRNTAARAKTGGGRAVARETSAPSGGENVFAALAASPTALLVTDLAKKIKASPQATRMALKRLQKQKRVFRAGSERRTFWAVAQEIADEAAA